MGPSGRIVTRHDSGALLLQDIAALPLATTRATRGEHSAHARVFRDYLAQGFGVEAAGLDGAGNPAGNPFAVTAPAGMPLPGEQTGRDLRRCSRVAPGGRVVSYFYP
jgi:hypothetical protein